MTVSVDINGRRYAVSVARRDGVFLVSINGRQRAVDVKEIGGVKSLLVGPPSEVAEATSDREGGASFSRPSRSYEVSTVPVGEDRLTVHVDGVPVEVEIAPSRLSWGRESASQGSGGGPQRIAAPMPGKIVRLLVKPGDRVEARQGLVVVEAMKMENELRARAAGTVAEVRAIEGTTVEAGAILITLE